MKLFLTLITIAVVLTAPSCKKETIKVKSNFDYLIAKPWAYKKYYVGYVDANNLGTLQYERGKTGNTIDLDNDISTFLYDNTVEETANGEGYPGEWHFLNQNLTQVLVTNSTGEYPTTIVLLDDTHYNWYYTDGTGVKRYAEMVHP